MTQLGTPVLDAPPPPTVMKVSVPIQDALNTGNGAEVDAADMVCCILYEPCGARQSKGEDGLVAIEKEIEV